jgi:hypothetical protein
MDRTIINSKNACANKLQWVSYARPSALKKAIANWTIIKKVDVSERRSVKSESCRRGVDQWSHHQMRAWNNWSIEGELVAIDWFTVRTKRTYYLLPSQQTTKSISTKSFQFLTIFTRCFCFFFRIFLFILTFLLSFLTLTMLLPVAQQMLRPQLWFSLSHIHLLNSGLQESIGDDLKLPTVDGGDPDDSFWNKQFPNCNSSGTCDVDPCLRTSACGSTTGMID